VKIFVTIFVTILGVLTISLTVLADPTNRDRDDSSQRTTPATQRNSDQEPREVVDANGNHYILTPVNSDNSCKNLQCRNGEYPNYSTCKCEGD